VKNKPILIVAGEPESVFLELFFKSLKFRYICPIVLICNKEILFKQIKDLNYKFSINDINFEEINSSKLVKNKINLINVNYRKLNNDNEKNKYISKSFEIAFKLIKRKFSYKFINGPINKNVYLKKKYLGVTEFIARNFSIKKYGMLIYNKKLSVSPVTTHLPIKLISKNISKNLIIEKIKLINKFFITHVGIKPRIAVAGLNPHCETILNYNEDTQIVSKSVKLAKKLKINVSGPFSGDTLFIKANRKKFDVILGMYHDQVLGPIKTLYEYDAINITIGLPFIRISPDHGPNKEMIGKNKSNPLSLIRALKFLDAR
jgi:4-hydroxy-L-threonine phosphate dehydrogenase PdxA